MLACAYVALGAIYALPSVYLGQPAANPGVTRALEAIYALPSVYLRLTPR